MKIKYNDNIMPENISRRNKEILEGSRRINSMKEAEDFLFNVLPNTPKVLFKGGESLYRSRYFLRELGNPQDEVKTIHIAGTSGKGSTSYILSSLLRAQGFTVGTHVSPHTYDVRERSMINLEVPEEPEYLTVLNEMVSTIASMDSKDTGRPTYFEVTMAEAFSLFARHKVDYTVLETGVGGRYDPSNSISRSDKLAVITRIGLDHTDVLGDTVDKIAYQKAGIIPSNGESLSIHQSSGAAERVIKEVAHERGSSLAFVDSSETVKNIHLTPQGVVFDYNDGELEIKDCVIPSLGTYQVENAVVAITTMKHLAKRDGFTIDPQSIKDGLNKAHIPGRSEIREYQGKTVMFDGAHNPQKLEALTKSIAELSLPRKPIWVIAAKKGKDAEGMLRIIAPYAEKIITSEFFKDEKAEHLKNFSLSADELASIARPLLDASTEIVPVKNSQLALGLALGGASKDQIIVVSGSIYFLGDIHKKQMSETKI